MKKQEYRIPDEYWKELMQKKHYKNNAKIDILINIKNHIRITNYSSTIKLVFNNNYVIIISNDNVKKKDVEQIINNKNIDSDIILDKYSF